jgi:hypothetical protein
MYFLSMPGHIQNIYRYTFYNRHKRYFSKDASLPRSQINIKRYLYFNNYKKYCNSTALVIHNSYNKSNIDLASQSIFIRSSKSKETDSMTQTDIDKAPYKCFNNNKDIINTFNVLDLLLPSINIRKTIDIPKILPIEYTPEEKEYDFEILHNKIETLDDLIILGEEYKSKYINMKKRFNINLRILYEMIQPLKELNNMIGMVNIKQSIFDKIILYLQGLDNTNKDYQHIVLCGGPGMGKTEVAKIIGRIYSKMGILSKGNFKEVKLTDLKAGYVGQSEIKTQKILDEAKGGILFIDEAYSLGSNDKIDSYSQSILDLINPYLDKNKNDFILIIAGYKDDLNSRFFKGNQGLKSRFGLWLEIDDYSSRDLKDIFIKKIREYEWLIKDDEIDESFFKKNKKNFKYYGRDIEIFFSKCKLAHAKRVLYCDPVCKKNILKQDILNGYDIYKKELNIDDHSISGALLESMYI